MQDAKLMLQSTVENIESKVMDKIENLGVVLTAEQATEIRAELCPLLSMIYDLHPKQSPPSPKTTIQVSTTQVMYNRRETHNKQKLLRQK